MKFTFWIIDTQKIILSSKLTKTWFELIETCSIFLFTIGQIYLKHLRGHKINCFILQFSQKVLIAFLFVFHIFEAQGANFLVILLYFFLVFVFLLWLPWGIELLMFYFSFLVFVLPFVLLQGAWLLVASLTLFFSYFGLFQLCFLFLFSLYSYHEELGSTDFWYCFVFPLCHVFKLLA